MELYVGNTMNELNNLNYCTSSLTLDSSLIKGNSCPSFLLK